MIFPTDAAISMCLSVSHWNKDPHHEYQNYHTEKAQMRTLLLVVPEDAIRVR